ncbi:hypothetical protein SO694_0015408 [Aureococcus anophagefferens]|uniref:SAP domain-containing protein n=1 Tax=Aureococcus anophagefferens TaxID=44056 RepID=A0ABR1G0R9_AURAN
MWQLYSRTNMNRWEGLMGRVLLRIFHDTLAETVVGQHLQRKQFAVGFYLGLVHLEISYVVDKQGKLRHRSENHDDNENTSPARLYKRVPIKDDDAVRGRYDVGQDPGGSRYKYEQLGDEDYFRIVAAGLPRPHGRKFYWETIKSYYHEFEKERGRFVPSDQGHHVKVKWLLQDENLRRQFEAYVNLHGEKKGAKNLTVSGLLKYTNDVIFKMASPTPLLTKPVSESAIYQWLGRLRYSFEGHEKAKYKDGALDDAVLDRLFHDVLPFWKQKVEEGMLVPGDFDGVTDDHEGYSFQAYEKARRRAVEYAYAAAAPDLKEKCPMLSDLFGFVGGAVSYVVLRAARCVCRSWKVYGAIPWLAWSHDEACADSMDAQDKAWVKEGAKRLRSKGNSGKKLMAAEMVCIIGNGTLFLNPAEFEAARADGYSRGPRALMLMEIGGQDENLEETIEALRGEGETDDAVELKTAVDKLQVKELKKELERRELPTTGNKQPLRDRLLTALRSNAGAAETFVNEGASTAETSTILKGYFKNDHVMVQAENFAALAWRKYPQFRHAIQYDNAPSHKKVAPGAPLLNTMAKGDGHGKCALKATTFQGQPQALTMPVPAGHVGEFYNKGLQRIGFERGYWPEDGRDAAGDPISLDAMRQRLGKDSDFANVKSKLEEFFDTQPHVAYMLCAKFWCDLQWVEQYWNDAKRKTRELCDYTITGLKRQFPLSLASVPISNQRNYMQRLDIMRASGDRPRRRLRPAKIPALKKQYKSHRQTSGLAPQAARARRPHRDARPPHHARPRRREQPSGRARARLGRRRAGRATRRMFVVSDEPVR